MNSTESSSIISTASAGPPSLGAPGFATGLPRRLGYSHELILWTGAWPSVVLSASDYDRYAGPCTHVYMLPHYRATARPTHELRTHGYCSDVVSRNVEPRSLSMIRMEASVYVTGRWFGTLSCL